MAIQQHELEENYPFLLLHDTLYYEEDCVREDNSSNPSFFPLLLLEQDSFWEDEELLSRFAKETQQVQLLHLNPNNVEATEHARREAVEWMLKVNAHYGFTTLTTVFSINYLDRFLSSFHLPTPGAKSSLILLHDMDNGKSKEDLRKEENEKFAPQKVMALEAALADLVSENTSGFL